VVWRIRRPEYFEKKWQNTKKMEKRTNSKSTLIGGSGMYRNVCPKSFSSGQRVWSAGWHLVAVGATWQAEIARRP